MKRGTSLFNSKCRKDNAAGPSRWDSVRFHFRSLRDGASGKAIAMAHQIAPLLNRHRRLRRWRPREDGDDTARMSSLPPARKSLPVGQRACRLPLAKRQTSPTKCKSRLRPLLHPKPTGGAQVFKMLARHQFHQVWKWVQLIVPIPEEVAHREHRCDGLPGSPCAKEHQNRQHRPTCSSPVSAASGGTVREPLMSAHLWEDLEGSLLTFLETTRPTASHRNRHQERRWRPVERNRRGRWRAPKSLWRSTCSPLKKKPSLWRN